MTHTTEVHTTMIAGPESTTDTMLRAFAYTLAGLGVAGEVDRDRSADDRGFFRDEHARAQPLMTRLLAAAQASEHHALTQAITCQVRVTMGDVVLDRGVRDAKARMRVELKGSAMPEGADHVFGSNVRDLIDAESRQEPGLVRQATDRFAQVPDFPGKDALHGDLVGRADQQERAFGLRDASDRTAATHNAALDLAVRDCADYLYGLEKRMLERFPRETTYVRAFFADVSSGRRARKAPVADPPVPPPSRAPTPGSGSGRNSTPPPA